MLVCIIKQNTTILLAPWRSDNAHLSLKLVTGSNVVGEHRILCVGVVVGIVIPEVSAVAVVLLILPHVGRRGTLHM